MILFWGVLLLLVVVLVRALMGQSGGSSRKDAREILDERYARGEIDRQEYLERKKTLD